MNKIAIAVVAALAGLLVVQTWCISALKSELASQGAAVLSGKTATGAGS